VTDASGEGEAEVIRGEGVLYEIYKDVHARIIGCREENLIVLKREREREREYKKKIARWGKTR
jgi:hypothetical protein